MSLGIDSNVQTLKSEYILSFVSVWFTFKRPVFGG